MTPFEDEQLEAAVSGVIFQIIEEVQTVGDAAFEVSFFNSFRSFMIYF